MDELTQLLNKFPISKSEGKKLQKLFNQQYGIRYGGCLCSLQEREELQKQIKNYIKNEQTRN